jgi:hypothetical protein
LQQGNKNQGKKTHMILSVNAKDLSQNSTSIPHLKKILNKRGIEQTYLNIIKAIYDKSKANITLYGENLKSFPLKSVMRQGSPLSTL